LLHARGDLSVGEKFRHLSVLDTAFECRIIETVKVGSVPAITPLVSGRAWLTGVSHYGVDPDDPFPEGYRLPDTWFSWNEVSAR
jgi:proline racemase